MNLLNRFHVERSDRALFVASSCIVLLSALIVLTFDHGRDQSIYHLVGREMLAGKMPYKDAFDFKPPGIFLIYAAVRAVFGATMRGIRIVEMGCLLVNAALLVALARAYFANVRAGYVAAALASQMHAQLDFWHTAQPETFGATLTLICLFVVRPTSTPTTRRYAIVGALLGFAFLLKPPLIGTGAIVLFGAANIPFRSSWRRALLALWRPVFGMAIGVVATVGSIVAYFASRGALPALYEVLFVFTPEYTRISWIDRTIPGMAYYGFSEWLTSYSALQCAGLLLCIALRAAHNRYGALTLAAIAIQTMGVVMQGKFFPYHYATTFLLAALLAGAGLERLLSLARQRWGLLGTVVCLLGFAFLFRGRALVPSFGNEFIERTAIRAKVFLGGHNTQQARDALASVADVDAAQNRQVAEFIRLNTAPDASVFVWGFECAIVDLAERRLASRYIYNVPQRASWSRQRTSQELFQELRRTLPEAIVVEHNDVFPMVTGDDLDSLRSLQHFPELANMIRDEYGLATSLGDFDIYLRARD